MKSNSILNKAKYTDNTDEWYTDYSTVEITVDEVEREVESEGYWSKIWNNIIKGFKNVGKIITTVFALIISAIPYLIIPAVIVILIFVIIHFCDKKKNSNKKQ